MAITPRSIIKSPLLLLIATLSVGAGLFGLYLLFFPCQSACTKSDKQVIKVVQRVEVSKKIDAGPCDYVFERAPSDMRNWSEPQFLRAAACFEANEDSRNVIRVADRGIRHYPASEPLYNAKAYHEIELKQYGAAVNTLETGLARVGTPSSGIMENNLAWAGLWENRRIDASRAKALYESSLRRNPNSCEAIHTGLWVEYALAAKAHSFKRKQAVKRYRDLRERYDGCESRLSNANANTVFEVLGAGVLDYEMERIDMRSQIERGVFTDKDQKPSKMLSMAVGKAVAMHSDLNLNQLCAESSPVRSAMFTCRALVRSEVVKHRQVNIRVLQ